MEKQAINYSLKALFQEFKKDNKVTSKDVAVALGVTPQTVVTMSGKLDQISVIQLAKLSRVLGSTPGELLFHILERCPDWIDWEAANKK